jgi:RNA recognition motif-containing protein
MGILEALFYLHLQIFFFLRRVDMSTKVHVGGLSYFCTDHTLRQAFIPFGTVVHAQVLRDECGHSLGLGVVHMASSEEVERVFNEHQRFEVSGSRVDLWEPAEPESPSHRVLAFTVRETPATQMDQDPGPEENQKALNPLRSVASASSGLGAFFLEGQTLPRPNRR